MTRPPRDLLELLSIAHDAQEAAKFEQADVILRQAVNVYAPTEFPVEILCPITIRMACVLCNARVETVADLLRRGLADVQCWKNFGQVSQSLLGIRLRALGLNLAGQHDYAWIKPLPMRLREHSVLIPAHTEWTWTTP